MHLAFVVNNVDFLLSHRRRLVTGALESGYRVSVITPPGAGVAELQALGAHVATWRLHRGSQQPLLEAQALAHLVFLYRALSPDVTHHVTVKPMLYGSLAARATGIKAVVNAVSGLGYVFVSEGLKAELRRSALRLAYRTAFSTPNSAVILQNDDDEALLRKLGTLEGARVVKIRGSGVDLRRFQKAPQPEGVPLIVLPARMLVDKGVREFVAAARVLKTWGLQVRCALVGGQDEGNPAGVPRAELEAWRREGVVEWWGHRSDMPEVIRQASIVCLPSYREGMPRTLLEAAAVGRAIVTTDVPGCRDAVAGGQIGLLVPAKAVRPLAEALASLLRNPSKRVELSELAATHAAAQFSEESVLTAHLALYRALEVDALSRD